MKHWTTILILLSLTTFLFAAETPIDIDRPLELGFPPPIPVAISGFTGEVDSVLKNDLRFMGFEYVSPDKAQFLINGKNTGNVECRVIERINRAVRLAKAYTGSTPRAQTHALADDIAVTLTGRPGIAQTKIAFKVETRLDKSEIYVADYDGFNAKSATQDGSLTVAPCWVGRSTIYYCSYKLGKPFIFGQHLTSGTRRTIASYPGLNTSPAVSSDGKRVAMILSKGGNPDLYVADADGGNVRQLTRTREEESSPCWSPDNRTICYVSRQNSIAGLYTISADGGAPKRLPTPGAPTPTEPDWSPDGRWIAFTTLARDFNICIVPAGGGKVTVLVAGEDPSWAPNSRALIYAHGPDGSKKLSLLDVPTRYVKDIPRILESNSQPSWAR
jgi:TolB protein